MLLRERLLGISRQRAEISTREELNDELYPVWRIRHCSVNVDRVGTPKADHGFQLPQNSLRWPVPPSSRAPNLWVMCNT